MRTELTVERDTFKRLGSFVRTRHGGKCLLMLRMAGFSHMKMADARSWTAGR